MPTTVAGKIADAVFDATGVRYDPYDEGQAYLLTAVFGVLFYATILGHEVAHAVGDDPFEGAHLQIGTHIVGIRHLHSIELLPATLDALQRSLPRLLQLRCDQAIVGVASGVAAFSERCIVLGLLQLQLGDAPPFLILVS